MDRYRQLQIFVAVARAGSLAGAARLLGQSPATVMRSVAALEARLQRTLLLRGPRGVALSPAGEHFAQSCRHILEQTEAAERSAAGRHASPDGQLRVALPQLMDVQLFTFVAVSYLDAFPQVQLVVRSCDGVPRLLEEGIDVALVLGDLPDSSQFSVPLGRVRPLVCASAAYLARCGRPETPDDLRAHRVVAIAAPGHDAQWTFSCGRSVRRVKPRQVLTSTTQRAAIRAATLGLGLLRCMSYEVHDELQQGLLEPLLSAFAAPGVPAQLIYRDGRRADARVRTFIDFATPLLRAHRAFHD